MPFSDTDRIPIVNILMKITVDSIRIRFDPVILYKQFPIE